MCHSFDSSDSLRGYHLHLEDHYRRKLLKLEKHRADADASRNGWNDYSDEFWIYYTPEYSCVTEFCLRAISRAPGVVQNKFFFFFDFLTIVAPFSWLRRCPQLISFKSFYD
uniref:Uncharacterized protein n=1 Tax=Glossina pallidipes TaxID=7398 RepID=A0A1B0A5J0_GLOPL